MKRKTALRSFIRLARPHFLIGGFAGFALGASVALAPQWVGFSFGAYLFGQSLVTAFHLMVHFANDYFDRETDAQTTRTAWSGGSGMLVDGSLAPGVALRAALACAALGTLCVLAALAAGRFLLAAIGVSIGALAWAYSAPPLRLCARGWGEITTVAVVAVLVPLAGFAAFESRLDAPILIACIAPATAMFAMMLAVELPDRDADAATGKANLVVRMGLPRALALMHGLRRSAIPALGSLDVVLRGVHSGRIVVFVALVVAVIAFDRNDVAIEREPFRGVFFYGFVVVLSIASVVVPA